MNEKTMKTMLLQLFLVLGILFPLGLHAQQINVRGTGSDQSNEPVIGASIAVKGGNTGAVTDIDGKFSIQTDANSTLTVSFLGYKTMTVPVNGRTMISSSSLNAPRDWNTTESLSATINIISPVSADIVLMIFFISSSLKNLAIGDFIPSSFS